METNFPTARAAAADHFRRRWATVDPAYADPANAEYYIKDDDNNIYEEPQFGVGKWIMYGSFDGSIFCTVKAKKDGTYWCPATSLIR
jgi:hypothetical protein